MAMKNWFIGCVEFCGSNFELLASMNSVGPVGLVTLKESPSNNDCRDLTPLVDRIACPTFFDEGDDAATA